jgi:hypothetical protein
MKNIAFATFCGWATATANQLRQRFAVRAAFAIGWPLLIAKAVVLGALIRRAWQIQLSKGSG